MSESVETNSENFAGSAELSRLSVSDLAVRFRLGSEDAFTVLSERLRPRLISFLHHRLGNLEDAEDVAQDSLARAWLQRAQFSPQFQFTTWLYTIAKNLATDHQRRRRHVAVSQIEVDLKQTAVSAPDRQSIAPPDENVWSIAHRCLSVDQYSAIWLRYGEGLSVREIATILGKSTVSVRVHLHRARRALKKVMKDETETQTQISTADSQSDGDSNSNEAER